MKYLKYFESNSTDFVKDGIKISDRRIFNSLTISTQNYKGKKKLIDFNIKDNELVRGNLSDGFGEFILDFLEENKKEIIELYGVRDFEKLYKAIGDRFFDLTNKSKVYYIDKPIVVASIHSYYYMNARSITVYDNMARIEGIHYGEKETFIVNKDSITAYDEECFLLGYYSKPMSKYYRYVEYSKNLYDIIKKYAPNFTPILIDIKFIESFGWEKNLYDRFLRVKGAYWNLEEGNLALFTKGDRTLLFSFDSNKAYFYNSEGELIEKEFNVIKKSEIEKFKNLLK
jgi:hypothetical protein